MTDTTETLTETTEETAIESALTTNEIESALTTEATGETTTETITTVFLPVDEQLTYVRSDLDMILGLIVAFMVIELCKWAYRFLNIFIPI